MESACFLQIESPTGQRRKSEVANLSLEAVGDPLNGCRVSARDCLPHSGYGLGSLLKKDLNDLPKQILIATKFGQGLPGVPCVGFRGNRTAQIGRAHV